MVNTFQRQYMHWLNTEKPPLRERTIMQTLMDGLKHQGEDHLALVPGEDGLALVILKEPHHSEDYTDLKGWESTIKHIAIEPFFSDYTIAFDGDHQHVNYYGPFDEGGLSVEGWANLENNGADQSSDEGFRPAWETIAMGLLDCANDYLSDRAIPVSKLLVHKETSKTIWLGGGHVEPQDLQKDLEHDRKWGFCDAERFARDGGVEAYRQVIRVRSWSGKYDADYSVEGARNGLWNTSQNGIGVCVK